MHKACSVAVLGGGIGGLSCASKLLQLLEPHCAATATVIDMGGSGPGAQWSWSSLLAALAVMGIAHGMESVSVIACFISGAVNA